MAMNTISDITFDGNRDYRVKCISFASAQQANKRKKLYSQPSFKSEGHI